jgi:cold-inducible RNA-binding protein
MTQRLYVGNLSHEITEQKLHDLFSQAGEISRVDVITDKFSGQAKGFAFVEMTTDAASQDAVTRFDGYSLDDRAMIVNVARPREDRSGQGRR